MSLLLSQPRAWTLAWPQAFDCQLPQPNQQPKTEKTNYFRWGGISIGKKTTPHHRVVTFPAGNLGISQEIHTMCSGVPSRIKPEGGK